VYADFFYPGIEMSMLHNVQVQQKPGRSDTNSFGTRCLKTLGVNFIGANKHTSADLPWASIDELIDFKNNMKKPPKDNVPILITRVRDDQIDISGRLEKSGRLAHDPNIGALSLISATLRKLGWKDNIRLVKHGLDQKMVSPSNKFVQIADRLGLKLEGIQLPTAVYPGDYWRYEDSGEKVGTIFVHIAVEEFSKGRAIYENHAGCERGYFFDQNGNPETISKRVKGQDGAMPKGAETIRLPDLLIADDDRRVIACIEGEKSVNALKGIKQLEGFSTLEKTYLKEFYPDFNYRRSVVLFGGESNSIEHPAVCLLLNASGEIYLNNSAPEVLREAITNLKTHWNKGD
jgi:hypothetical protein